MPKTPEEVIARLQRSNAAAGRHMIGLIANQHTLRHETKKLEELLGWVHKKLRGGGDNREEIMATIEQTIPRYLKRKGQL